MRPVVALVVASLLAFTAVAQPSPEASEADPGRPETAPDSSARNASAERGGDPPENRSENRSRGVQVTAPSPWFNATADPETGRAHADVHVLHPWASAGASVDADGDAGADGSAGVRPPNGTGARDPPRPDNVTGEPAMALSFDLPDDANAGEILLVTVRVLLPDGARLTNVTIRVEADPAYVVLPAHHHDAWNGGNLTFHLDEVYEDGSVYFHVLAPTEARDTSFRATASTDAQEAQAARDLRVRAPAEAEPGYARREALVAVGYAATLTAVGI